MRAPVNRPESDTDASGTTSLETGSPDTEPYRAPDQEAALVAEGAPDREVITGRRLVLVFSALMLTMFLAALDQTIVSTALPRITSDFGALSQLAWVVTAYLLTSTASTPIWGKISDLYGRKPMIQAAIVIFLLGSVLAGLAQSMTWLIVTRGIQGLGGGGLMVLVMAVIADVIPPRERGRYTGLFGGVFALSSVAGPLLGGWFVDGPGWRWIFFINVPVGIAALFVLAIALKVPVRRVNHRIDYLGAGLMVAATVLVLLIVEWGGHQYAWLSPTILLMFVIAVAAITAFIMVERRASEPILPMSLFSNRVFSVSSGIGFVVGLTMFGAIIFLPLYLQIVQGSTPTMAGLQLLPMMVGLLSMSILSGRLISRIGRYKPFPIIGTFLATIGLLLLATIDVTTPYWRIAVAMLILGAGLGNVMQVLIIAVQNSVHPRDIGVATSGSTFVRSIGGTFGTAIFGAVMTAQLTAHIKELLPPDIAAKVDIDQITGAMSQIAQLPAELKQVVLTAFSDSLATVFLTAGLISAAGFVLSLFLPDSRLQGVDARRESGSAVEPAGL